MLAEPSASLPSVLQQYLDEAANLFVARGTLIHRADVRHRDLRRFDERLAAYLDGLVDAAGDSSPICEAALDDASPGSVFVVMVRALSDPTVERLERALTVNETGPHLDSELATALGWVERGRLSGIGKQLLESSSTFRRRLGLAACRLHGVDPGPTLLAGLKDQDPQVRAEALRTAGELGRHQLVSPLGSLNDADPNCQFWASWSAVLLGDRTRALESLRTTGMSPDSLHRARAFRLALQAMTPRTAHTTLQRLGGEPAQLRWLIQGSGINGDPTYVPWLVRHMADEKLSRLAGESFALITGADLDLLQLWRARPENVESGPTDNPDDENVEMDPDEGLMWPDPEKVANWWEQNKTRFQPGARYFMGAPVTREHCIQVLKEGYQRQRMLAAHYLCLLQPGTPLFNTSAPAWRQQKLLAQM